jgi:hypothetical protein
VQIIAPLALKESGPVAKGGSPASESSAVAPGAIVNDVEMLAKIVKLV